VSPKDKKKKLKHPIFFNYEVQSGWRASLIESRKLKMAGALT
jgi:hypothetical protein